MLIGIVPVIIGSTVGIKYFRKSGDVLVEQSRKMSISSMEKRLRLLVDSYATVLQHGRENMEMSLAIQAHEVEKALAREPFEIPPVYFTQNLNEDNRLADHLIPSSFHFRTLLSGEISLLKISYEAAVFNLAPGVKRDDVEKDIARLSTLSPVYREISRKYNDLLYWQYTSLENGLHSEYPAHRQILKGFDHRKQAWYMEALRKNRMSAPWFYAFVDPATLRPVFAATMPVKRPNGKTAGITALVFPLSSLLEYKLLVQNIPTGTKPFICAFMTDPVSGKHHTDIIISDEQNEIRHRDLNAPIQIKRLESSASEKFEKMLHDLETGMPNVRRMPYQGMDSLWVYRNLGFRTSLVLITPYKEILKPARQNAEHIQNLITTLFKVSEYIVTGVLFITFFLSLFLSKMVTKPMQALSDGAMKLGDGDFDTKVTINTKDEFGEMGRVFNLVGPRLKEHYKMRHSLALAMEIQQKLLPKFDPEVEGLDISGKSRYCDEIGGDYYDFLNTDEFAKGKISLAVGDVADHGISSALLMTTARALLRQSSSRADNLARIVSEVNVQLTYDIYDSGQFVTMFLGAIDRQQRTFRWIRAGHEPAMVYNSITGDFEELKGPGMALGVDKNFKYTEMERELNEGEIIIIGTDGVWETHNAGGALFGKKRLQEIIQRNAEKPAKEIVNRVMAAVDKFRAPLGQEDDNTLVVIKVNSLQAAP